MCDPLTLAGLALSGAGSLSQAQTQNNYVNAVNAENRKAYEMSKAAREAERERQKALEAEGNAAFEQTNADLTRENFDANAEAKATNFVSMLDAAPQSITTDTRLPGQEGASVAVKEGINARIAEEAAKTRDRIRAFSELTSYAGTGQDRAMGLSTTGDMLAILGGLRRGSLAVGQQEQEIPAASVTPGSGALGAILSGIGGVTSGMAGYKSGQPLFNFSLGQPGMTYGSPLKFSPGMMPPVG